MSLPKEYPACLRRATRRQSHTALHLSQRSNQPNQTELLPHLPSWHFLTRKGGRAAGQACETAEDPVIPCWNPALTLLWRQEAKLGQITTNTQEKAES